MSPAESIHERSSTPITSPAASPSARHATRAASFGQAARRLAGPALTALLALSTPWLTACGGDEGGNKDEGDFASEWEPGGSDLADVLEDEELFEDLADALNDSFKLPRDLPIVHTRCGEANAFYDPEQGALLMCYELLDVIADMSVDLAADDDELGERIIGTWTFVFFHELGHGLIDLYDLPITGKEEDAVDDFSTLLMINADLAGYAAYAADFWNALGTEVSDQSQFADEHSLNAQRFYNIMCLIYGSDPDRYEGAITSGLLPQSRAVRCPGEYEQKLKAWDTLLKPWSKE